MISRRGFLQAATATAAGEVLGSPWAAGAAQAATPAGAAGAGRALVVSAKSAAAVSGGLVREDVLAELLRQAVLAAGDGPTPQQAWAGVLGGARTFGLRVEGLPQDPLHTALPLARCLIASLMEGGWNAEQLVVQDPPAELVSEFGVRPARWGWSASAVNFEGGSDQLCAFVEEVDALVNVAVLKDDNVQGLGGCVRGATYDLLRHPARTQRTAGPGFLAEVLALPLLRTRLRLHLLSALRMICNGGPLVDPSHVDDSGLLLVSRDPVAADVIGLEALNQARAGRSLQPITLNEDRVPLLFHAARLGAGQVDPRRIVKRIATID
jgi:hypothetical protein